MILVSVITILKQGINSAGLQTDHTKVMKQIEEKLLQIHADARDSKENNRDAPSSQPRLPPRVLSAFAKVDRVDPGSPASRAVSTNKYAS